MPVTLWPGESETLHGGAVLCCHACDSRCRRPAERAVIAILGGLGAAAAWALSTLCSSRSSRMIAPSSVVAWMMLVGLLITVAGRRAERGAEPARSEARAPGWPLSGAGNVVGLVLTYSALRIGQVTLVAPLVSTEGAVAAVIAVIAGEPLAPGVAADAGGDRGRRLAGLGAARPARRDRRPATRHRRPSHPTYAVLLAMAAALAFGVSLYATARAGAELPVSWVVLSARAIGVVALALPLALARRLEITRPRRPAGGRVGGVRGARLLLLHDGRPARHRGGRGARPRRSAGWPRSAAISCSASGSAASARSACARCSPGVAVLSALRA